MNILSLVSLNNKGFGTGFINDRKKGGKKETREQEIHEASDCIVENTFKNRAKISADRVINAFTIYPAKGIKGDKNSNFYEFLAMGTIPYILGSASLMLISPIAKYYDKHGSKQASKYCNAFAFGVLAYGVLKNISKNFIKKPVKWITGIDVDLPYKKVVRDLPSTSDGKVNANIEYHKVFESADFTRSDLLYDYEKYGKKRGSYYDYIAQKNGLGKNLNASDQIVKPFIHKVVVKERLAETWSSYAWAILGVGLCMQNSTQEFFGLKPTAKGIQKMAPSNILGKTKKLASTLVESFKEMHSKKAGKALIYTAIASTILGNIISLTNNKPQKQKNKINLNNKDNVVC